MVQLFWFGLPKFPFEHFFSIDLFSVWRHHLIFSKKDGRKLRELLTQRMSSNTVFLSLMLSTEIGVFFSPSDPVQEVREAMENKEWNLRTVTGTFLCFSILSSIAALACNFTAWGIFSTVSDQNVHAVLRSSIGMYGANLPARLILGSMYLFFIWVCLFWSLIMKPVWASISIAVGAVLIIHIMSTYSAIGRIIIATSAMSDNETISANRIEEMEPDEVELQLLEKLKIYKAKKIPVSHQYRESQRQGIQDMMGETGAEESRPA